LLKYKIFLVVDVEFASRCSLSSLVSGPPTLLSFAPDWPLLEFVAEALVVDDMLTGRLLSAPAECCFVDCAAVGGAELSAAEEIGILRGCVAGSGLAIGSPASKSLNDRVMVYQASPK
jgi:hypothetical protein